jgi:hypothetical protein
MSLADGLVTLLEGIALSESGSSVIGTLRTELDTEGLLSESKLALTISPLVLRGAKISIDDRDEVRRGGGGGGAVVLFDSAVGVIDRLEGTDVEERFDEARFREGGGGGDLKLVIRVILGGEPSSTV